MYGECSSLQGAGAMKQTMVTGAIAAMLLAFLVASPAAEALTGSGSTSVQASAYVRAKVVYSVVDNTICLRANAPWRVTLLSATGADTFVGPATGSAGARVPILEGATDFFVTLDQ
jgi:hypothetical protein